MYLRELNIKSSKSVSRDIQILEILEIYIVLSVNQVILNINEFIEFSQQINYYTNNFHIENFSISKF